MEIKLGAPVVGSDGAHLGHVMAAIADARSDRITDIVVKHGTISVHKQVVPLSHVTSVTDGEVHVGMNLRALDQEEGLTGPAHAADIDYVGTPGTDQDGDFRGDLQFDAFADSFGHMGGKVGGFPGGEQIGPDLMERPEIFPGMAVLDDVGQKVGELGEFSFEVETGAPVRVTVKSGFLFKSETELPLSWVRDLGEHGILLNVDGNKVKTLSKTHHQS
jgi:uncharacterized protein YrrD